MSKLDELRRRRRALLHDVAQLTVLYILLGLLAAAVVVLFVVLR
jgi:hypothetical protein